MDSPGSYVRQSFRQLGIDKPTLFGRVVVVSVRNLRVVDRLLRYDYDFAAMDVMV
jgi:hypothetical protein